MNCYVLVDAATKETCIIDPGGDPNIIKNFLQKNGFALKFIINTHGHGDHIAANAFFGAPIYIHRLDNDFLTDPSKNLSKSFLFRVSSPAASRLLEGGDRIQLGQLELEVIHTPGHTPGSISIKVGHIVFTGDTLFHGSIGRADLGYGDEEQLLRSIKERLLILGERTEIYPGHGDHSTIGEEKRSNPFLT
jgi:glyoxylase-like metal-dependent hydrolase (beta-lactamase superfamily II)